MRTLLQHGYGIGGLYEGFNAHLTARLLHMTIRNSLYKWGFDNSGVTKPNNDLTAREKAVLASAAATIAVVLTNPLTVVSVRQCNDWQLRPEWRRNYTSMMEGLRHLNQTGDFYKGLNANILKTIALNSSMNYTYSSIKDTLISRGGMWPYFPFLSFTVAAAVGTLLSLPFDNIRTRLMQMHPEKERNRINFSGIAEGFLKIAAFEMRQHSYLVGFYTAYLYNFLYFGISLYITEEIKHSWKLKAGVPEYNW